MAKRQFDILTDSCADMGEAYYEKNGVDVVRLGFTMNNVNYGGEDGEKIALKDFYEKLRGGAMPTTYQVTGESAKEHMESHLNAGRDLLVLSFSSGLSGTHGSYVVAARALKEKYPDRKIFVVDSLCACMGEGLLLDYLVRKADEGATIEEARDYLEEIKLKICHHFTVDSLFHLKRGGRVSPTVAFVGGLLGIKPVLHVDDEGHLIKVNTARGRKASLNALADELVNTILPDSPVWISHGDCEGDAKLLADIVREKSGKEVTLITDVGPVIGAHSGPGTMALFFLASKR